MTRRAAYTIAALSVTAAAVIADPWWLGLGMVAIGVAAILWLAAGADLAEPPELDSDDERITDRAALARLDGWHESYPDLPEDIRRIDIDYCESMWAQPTVEVER